MSYMSALHRGIVYVLIALLTQAVTDLPSAFSSDPVTMSKFWLQVSLAGLITWRAYIDKSPAQVEEKSNEQPVVETASKTV